MSYTMSKSMDEILNDKQKALAMWQGLIQKCIDTNDVDGVERLKKDMAGCENRYDKAISEKKLQLQEFELQQLEHKKRVQDLLHGPGQLVELMTDVMGGKHINGFVMIGQWYEEQIQDGFTTFEEMLHLGLPYFTLYRPNELKEKRAHFGSVLYEIAPNGIMKKIDSNYDGGD